MRMGGAYSRCAAQSTLRAHAKPLASHPDASGSTYTPWLAEWIAHSPLSAIPSWVMPDSVAFELKCAEPKNRRSAGWTPDSGTRADLGISPACSAAVRPRIEAPHGRPET